MPKTYLPSVAKFGNMVESQADGQDGMTERAFQFSQMWLALLGERAEIMLSDSRLIKCAQDHADWSVPRLGNTESGHIGRNGSTPNVRVREAGYRLLDWHKNGNTVESSKRTWVNLDEDMVGVVSRLMAHETHHDHLWGVGFWEPSVVYGVGSANEPSGSTYFVCLICPPEL